jgi:hypothetical protein
MRAREFVILRETAESSGEIDSTAGTHPGHVHDGKRNKIHDHHNDAIPGMVTIPEWPGQYYNMYRLGVHMAGSPHNASEEQGYASNEMVMTQFTDVDTDMINHSAKAMGVKVKAISSQGSSEPKETNKISTVAKPKRNKYGI